MTLKEILSGKVAVRVKDKDFEEFEELCKNESIEVGVSYKGKYYFKMNYFTEFYAIGGCE